METQDRWSSGGPAEEIAQRSTSWTLSRTETPSTIQVSEAEAVSQVDLTWMTKASGTGCPQGEIWRMAAQHLCWFPALVCSNGREQAVKSSSDRGTPDNAAIDLVPESRQISRASPKVSQLGSRLG